MVKAVTIEVSARHVHLTQADFEKLFGAGKSLTVKHPLSMPYYFVANEHVEVIGPEMSFKVGIVGPFRDYSQFETSIAEARELGLEPKLAVSGDLSQALPITLKGEVGELNLPAAVIIPHRHLHVNPAEATELGLKDGQMVKVQIEGARAAVLGQIVVRIDERFSCRVHLDIDEGNAVGLPQGGQGQLII